MDYLISDYYYNKIERAKENLLEAQKQVDSILGKKTKPLIDNAISHLNSVLLMSEKVNKTDVKSPSSELNFLRSLYNCDDKYLTPSMSVFADWDEIQKQAERDGLF